MWVELRKGPAPLLGLLVAAACTLLLIMDGQEWTGRWVAMTVWLRGELSWMAAISAGFAVWVAGRDRRSGISEATSVTPRPQWHRAVRSCLALSICAIAGYLFAFGVGAVMVGRISTYGNAHWVPLLLVGSAAAIPACTLGYAVGQRTTRAVAAPATIAVVAWLMSLPTANNRFDLLNPMVTEGWSPAGYLEWRGHVGQALTLAGLAAGFLIAGSSRRWWLSTAPIVCGIIAALLLFGSHPAQLWRPDPVARQQVCQGQEISFCTFREQGYILHAIVPTFERALAPLDGLPGAPKRLADFGVLGGKTDFFVEPNSVDLFGNLDNPEWTADIFLENLHFACQQGAQGDEIFRSWLSGDDGLLTDARQENVLRRLRALPRTEQRHRVQVFLVARKHCDPRAGRVFS